MTSHVRITINGKAYESDIEPRLLLTHFIRDVAGLTGTHIGCETSICGSCTVMANGLAVKSCTMFAVQADGTLDAGKTFFDGTALFQKRKKGLPDGLKVDAAGNLFATGPGGVLVIAPDGTHLGTILTGQEIGRAHV